MLCTEQRDTVKRCIVSADDEKQEEKRKCNNLVAEMNFSEELVDENNTESGMKYTLNGTEIFYDEYTELGSKIFAAQVSIN